MIKGDVHTNTVIWKFIFMFFIVSAVGMWQTSAVYADEVDTTYDTIQLSKGIGDTIVSTQATEATDAATITDEKVSADAVVNASAIDDGKADQTGSLEAVSEGEQTKDPNEENIPSQPEVKNGWLITEDGSEYYYENGVVHTGWLVTNTRGDGLQRYWFNSDGTLAKKQIISASEAGYCAYATELGYVVRGKYVTSDGKIYLANNDGKLEDPGWVVTSYYDGKMQRYWINEDHSAQTGFFQVGDSWYHGNTVTGYVVRGKIAYDGSFILANNDGKLEDPGWVVTSYYDGKMQRYWINEDHSAQTGFFQVGDSWYHGNTVTGYVVRGKIAYDGSFMLANNDGILQGPGWVVTNAFDGSMQRYYIQDNGIFTAKTGFFQVGDSWYHGNTVTGYVVRGKARYGNGMLLADNDGVLAWEEGWLITDKYDGSMQRYRIDNSCGGYMGAHLGQFAIDGKSYYGREDTGYVVRGLYRNPSGQYYYGNNDGVLQPLPSNYAMLYKAQSYSSGTKYLILVDRSAHKVGVFQGTHNNWNQLYNWSCVVGAPGTPTITGVYHTTGGKRTSLSTDSRAIWCTQIWGGYFFHSILTSESELGQSLSHGCIRLPYSAARWIYDNINFGTTVVIYN